MSPVDSDWQCASYGKDTCTIHNSNLTEDSTFYVGVTCLGHDCSFQLKVMLTSEFLLEDGIEFQTYLYKEDARIFRFTIPPQIGDNTSITLKASAYRGSAHDFKFEVRGAKEGSIDIAHGMPAWKKGQVVRVNSKNFDGWCKGCEVKILLDVQDAGYYHIMAQSTDSLPLLQNMNQIDDIVDIDDIQCYRYFVSSEETDVQIQLSTYSGRVQLHANSLTIPQKWEDFQIKPNDTGDTDLILDMRPWIRQHRTGKLTGLYNICVKGDLTATYSLRLKEFIQDMSNPIEIEDGFSEHFFSRGNGMQLFLYTVPKLEYGGEDIKVEFSMTVKRGNAESLVLAAALCESENITNCTENLDQQQVLMLPTRYQKAKKVAGPNELKLVLDHDEAKCEKQLHGHCTYVVAVVNTGGSERQHWARYKIMASHSQNNHILLQEGQTQVFSVDHKKYKYFKFTLMEQDQSKLENVTFELSPLHGDCDLVLSRNNSQMFPTKEDGQYEIKSQRIGALVDHITVQKNTTPGALSLSTTYYIGVFGYTQTTFSLIVIVQRNHGDKQSLTQKRFSTIINEGFPLNKRLHNELDMFFGHFQVDISDGDEQAILIDVANSEGKTSTFVRYGSAPDLTNYDKKLSGGGLIKISPGDSAYHKQGTYYVMVLPDFQFFDIFIDNYYTFQFTWRTEETIAHLTPQRLMNLQVKSETPSYFRHFVQETSDDIRISVMSNSGSLDLYINVGSSDPVSHSPNSTNFEFSTKYMKGGNYMNSKSILLPIALLQNTNAACKDFGYAEDQSCVIYIGVLCADQKGECDGQIELDYESKTPKRVYPGQTKHQIMQSDSVNYYYLSVTPQTLQDLTVVLTPLVGDADLYVQIQKLNHEQLSSSTTAGMNGYLGWALPDEINNTYESKTRINSEMINMPKKELANHCGFKEPVPEAQAECLMVFAVIPYVEKSIGPLLPADQIASVPEVQIHYDFSIYKNFVHVTKQTPINGYVSQGEFKYYLYKETCEKCTILISSVSLTSSGDMEVFIKKGPAKLPTQTDFDLRRNTLRSEIISLTLKDTNFLQNATTMADYYILGIYGDKNTTFQLSVTSSDEPVIQLTDGISLKHQQEPFTITYFQYYHFYYDFDIELELHVSQGSADVYVTTFNQTGEDFVQKLPKRKSDAIWISEDINSMNSGSEDKEVLILQNDRKYCVDCYYLIGVVTHEGPATYQLSLLASEVERNDSSRLLRLGMQKTVMLSQLGNKSIRYQFMLDSKEPFSIIPTQMTGKFKISLSFGDLKDAFYSQESASVIHIAADQIKTDQNYFIFIEALSDLVELSLSVHQSHSVMILSDGLPQLVSYEDYLDTSKYMIFNLPQGTSTVVFSVKSKTPDFFPRLYISLMNTSNPQVFPPDELLTYDVYQEQDWDQDLYALKASFKCENITGGSFLAINLRYQIVSDTFNIQSTSSKNRSFSAQALITVTHTKVTKLPDGEDYFGELTQGSYRFHLFKIVVPNAKKTTMISYSLCLGTVMISLVKDPGNLAERVPIEFRESEGKRVAIVQGLEEEAYILVESYSTDTDEPTEYMLRVDFYDSVLLGLTTREYFIAQDGGRIRYEYLRRKGNVKINWGPLYQIPSVQNGPVEGVKYKLVFSMNPNAIMDSVCAIKRSGIAQSSVFTVYEDVDGDNEFVVELIPDKDFQFNVIAVVGKDQLAIPYKPVYLRVPDRRANGGRVFISLLFLAVIVFALLALFYFCKGRKLQNRLAEEVRDVNASSEGGQTMSYRRVKEDQQV